MTFLGHPKRVPQAHPPDRPRHSDGYGGQTDCDRRRGQRSSSGVRVAQSGWPALAGATLANRISQSGPVPGRQRSGYPDYWRIDIRPRQSAVVLSSIPPSRRQRTGPRQLRFECAELPRNGAVGGLPFHFGSDVPGPDRPRCQDATGDAVLAECDGHRPAVGVRLHGDRWSHS